MKKQAFLEKISKEIKEKEKINLIKKKQAALAAANNVEEYLKVDSDEDE